MGAHVLRLARDLCKISVVISIITASTNFKIVSWSNGMTLASDARSASSILAEAANLTYDESIRMTVASIGAILSVPYLN